MRRYYRGIRFASDSDLLQARKEAGDAFREATEVRDYIKDSLVYLTGYVKANPGDKNVRVIVDKMKEALKTNEKTLDILNNCARAILNAERM